MDLNESNSQTVKHVLGCNMETRGFLLANPMLSFLLAATLLSRYFNTCGATGSSCTLR